MNKKVLLIEDELFIRDLYVRVLEQAGLNIISAEDGEQGLAAAKKEIPDLILLDIMLPKMNGIVVLESLKSDQTTKAIPVVLITNLGQEDIIKKAFDLGAQGYLLKMRVAPNQLLDQVNTYLNNPAYKMDYNTLTFD